MPAASPSPASSDAKAKPAPKPVEITFDQIRRRLSLLPVGIDVFYQTISPDGKWVLMIAGVANQSNLYTFPLDELSKDPFIAKQLTSTAGGKRSAQFSPDSKEVYYLEQGRITIVDRGGLEAAACECYSAVRRGFSHLLGAERG